MSGSIRWSVAGVLLGIPLAFGLSRLMSSFLYRVELGDLWIYAGSVAFMLAVVAATAYAPARRAAGIEPAAALRYE